MVYGIDNEASLQKLPDKSQISQEKEWILQLEIEKKGKENTKNFSKTSQVDQPDPSVLSEQKELEKYRKCL